MRRGLSGRTWVGLGLEGWKGSDGHSKFGLVVETNVGVVNAALLVYEDGSQHDLTTSDEDWIHTVAG